MGHWPSLWVVQRRFGRHHAVQNLGYGPRVMLNEGKGWVSHHVRSKQELSCDILCSFIFFYPFCFLKLIIKIKEDEVYDSNDCSISSWSPYVLLAEKIPVRRARACKKREYGFFQKAP